MKHKTFYGIRWTNSFGKRVFYPEKVWTKKAYALKAVTRLRIQKMKSGTKMRRVNIVKLKV